MAERLKNAIMGAMEARASDIHISVGRPIQFRCSGELLFWNDEVLTGSDVIACADEIMDARTRSVLERDGEVDFAYSFRDLTRLRCNIYHERGNYALALRLLPVKMPTIEETKVPEAVVKSSCKKRGLVLVTGPTGSGKSTTLAAVINYLNCNYKKHIVTLEDPVEFVHPHIQSVIHQREIGVDTKSFSAALRAALRQDPDVILVGEMRDLETISTAITAAETGHLVLATLHTNSAAATVDRVIDAFPEEQQQQIRIQLANAIECILCQSLVPTVDGKREAAFEVMVATNAIRNLIRENKTFQITSNIQTGKKLGMQTMDDHLSELYLHRRISLNTAVDFAHDPTTLQKKIMNI